MQQPGGDAEAAGLALMEEAGIAITAGVDRLAAAWVVRVVTEVVDAWGRLDEGTRTDTLARARAAGEDAATRVGAELRTLFATDPARQRTTPLEIVRSLRFEATAVLDAAGLAKRECCAHAHFDLVRSSRDSEGPRWMTSPSVRRHPSPAIGRVRNQRWRTRSSGSGRSSRMRPTSWRSWIHPVW